MATILVVEDHPTTRKLVRVTLGGAGFRVLEAGSGAEAVALASEEPDLILLDLHLPDMSGFDVVERLREAGLGMDCPILAFSGFLPALEDGRVVAAGLSGFVTKPVEPSRLLEIVRLHLPSPSRPVRQGGGLRVLVVEDDGIQRKLLVSKLTRLGYDVREAADGEAALALLRKVPVDVVVSDVLMPRRDGFELSLAIRTTPSLAHIPVVLVSAHAQEGNDQRLAEVVGAHALVQRQAGYEGIEATLEAAVRAGPHPCAPAQVEELHSGYLHRVIRQLERQGAFNSHLAQQASAQATQLNILAGTTEILTRTFDAGILLAEMLDRILETLNLPQGAAYLREGNSFSLHAQRGFDGATAQELDRIFGCESLLREVVEKREPIFVPASVPHGGGAAGGAPSRPPADPGALMVVPLLSGQDVLGVYVICCGAQHVGLEWRPFALAIGAQVGQALAAARALGQLATSEQRAQSILDALSEGVVLVDRDGNVGSCNSSAARLLGPDGTPMTGRRLDHLVGRLRHEDGTILSYDDFTISRALRTGRPQAHVCTLDSASTGRRVWLSVRTAPLLRAGETEPYAAVTSYSDVTEQRRLEEMLRQSQKLEAIGRLAGGIAHDFNNLLMVIGSFSELGLASAAPDSELASDLGEIRRAADRASALTRQLLAFSRSQEMELRVLDVSAVVRDMEKMLRRLMPANIEFVVRLAAEPLRVRVDSGQMEQVLVNLAVNAGDAMPDGGTLTIATAPVELAEHEAALTGVAPGSYVQLVVRDTGVGVSEGVRDRMFDPFFTTKAPDKGSGLGLATVYGIVQQSGGAITVDSAPGRGAIFRIVLPLAPEPDMTEPEPASSAAADMLPRTILVTEDKEPLRRGIATWLRQRGHTILEASTGEEALRVAAGHQGPIDLLLTDVTMPVLGGIELARRLSPLRPEMRVLFMSGYLDHTGPDGLPPKLPATYLTKPFTLDSLGHRVHEILAAVTPPAGGRRAR